MVERVGDDGANAQSHSPDQPINQLSESHAILERARTGTRLMTIRGAAMRGISVTANLLLLVLVSPTELGLLAVVRGTFTLLQYLAELGIGKALLRRPDTPKASEYAALAGMQLLVGVVVIGVAALWPSTMLGFGAIDMRWRWWMLATVTTMLTLALGTGARVRLERALSYERLAMVDVFNVLTLNLGLVVFALLHHFSVGVFVVLGVATTAANALLYYWAPGPAPSLDLRPLSAIARESGGFLTASTCAVLREQGTPVLVGGLFGLPVAGLYSFAERLAQLLNVTFDGFRNAIVPAAVRLAFDRASLKALASRTLNGSASLAAPMAVTAVCVLPMLSQHLPKWTPAVFLTQCYIISYAVYGVIAASLEPVAVATRGARAAMAEQGTATVGGWLAFIALRSMGPSYLPLAVIIMYALPLMALFAVTSSSVRPVMSGDIARIAVGFVGSLALFAVLRIMDAPLASSALLPMVVMLACLPKVQAYSSVMLARWQARRARA